jgi:glutaminyl-tRNA synthetase
VSGWDDPRMPTLRGMRRRGYTPEALRDLCERVGVSKRNATIDVTLLEHHVREHLNATSPRVMGILHPLKVVLTNVPEGEVTWIEQAEYFKDEPARGTRRVPLTRTMLDRARRLQGGAGQGLVAPQPRHGGPPAPRRVGLIRCDEIIKNAATR